MVDEPTRRLDEGALRALVPRVLAGLVRRGEDFDAAEDALQEALLEALRVWPEHPRDQVAPEPAQPTRVRAWPRLVDHAASSSDGEPDMTSRTSIHSYMGPPPGPGSEET